MKLNWLLTKTIATFCSVVVFTACGDVVVKVQKKPKDVDLKSIDQTGTSNATDLNLANTEDFLKHLDGLKGIAADLLIKQLAQKDYVGDFRAAVRKYRSYVIEHATQPVKIDDSFYTQSTEECRKSGISLNMDQSNEFLGLILKTALLAKIGEVSAGKLNPGLSKEIAAISKLILAELGVKIEGSADVEKQDAVTVSKGTVSISLVEIDGETVNGVVVDAAMKARDKAEVLTIEFNRSLASDYVGTFEAKISIGHKIAGDQVETLQGNLKVNRKKLDSRFVHGLEFALGVAGKEPNYKRSMTFEQVDSSKKQIKLTDTLKPGTPDAKSFVTLLDLEKGTQCKVVLDTKDTTPVVPTTTVVPASPTPSPTATSTPDDKKGDETSFIPVDNDDDKTSTPVTTTGKPQTPGQHAVVNNPSQQAKP